MAPKFKNVKNKDIRTLKDTSENITHQKHIIQEGFFHVILSNNSENSEPKPEFKLCTFQCGEFSIDNRCDKHVKKLQL